MGLQKIGSSKGNVTQLNLGLICPHSMFNKRDYIKKIKSAVDDINTPSKKRKKFKFLEKFQFKFENVHMIMMTVNPSPTGR